MLNPLRNVINNEESSEMLGVAFWSFKREGWQSWFPTCFIKSRVVVKLPPGGSVHFWAWSPLGLQSLEPCLRWKEGKPKQYCLVQGSPLRKCLPNHLRRKKKIPFYHFEANNKKAWKYSLWLLRILAFALRNS